MPKHRDRRATPPCAKIRPPRSGRPWKTIERRRLLAGSAATRLRRAPRRWSSTGDHDPCADRVQTLSCAARLDEPGERRAHRGRRRRGQRFDTGEQCVAVMTGRGMCHLPCAELAFSDRPPRQHDDGAVARVALDPLERRLDIRRLALQHLKEAALVGIEHARQPLRTVVPARHLQDRGDIARRSPARRAADIDQLLHHSHLHERPPAQRTA